MGVVRDVRPRARVTPDEEGRQGEKKGEGEDRASPPRRSEIITAVLGTSGLRGDGTAHGAGTNTAETGDSGEELGRARNKVKC